MGKGRRSRKRRAEADRALAFAFLKYNLRLLPFSPSPTPDHHEPLLRAAGLWAFARLPLDRRLRSDLLAPLLASYDPNHRLGLVRDLPVSLRRADLAGALVLPSSKPHARRAEHAEALCADKAAVRVILRFVFDRMLCREEAGFLPDAVREGRAHCVDWAEMLRAAMERDILRARRTGECRYASHLQWLLRHQHPALFGSGDAMRKQVIEIEKDDVFVDLDECSSGEEKKEDGSSYAKKRAFTLIEVDEAEDEVLNASRDKIPMKLGTVVSFVDRAADEHCKEQVDKFQISEKDEGIWNLPMCGKSNDAKAIQQEDLGEDGKSGGDDGRRSDDIPPKSPALQRPVFKNHLPKTDTVDIPDDTPPGKSPERFHGKFVAIMAGGSLLVKGNHKRKITEIIADEDDNRKKRVRSREYREEALPALATCGKGEMMFEGKEHNCANAKLELQQLKELLQEKDRIIQTLEKAHVEDQKKRQQEFSWYKHEVNVMSKLVHGYKKALGETRNTFAEYRKKYPQGDEPMYRDVGGTGGLVLSTREIRRKQFEEEEEMCKLALEKITKFQNNWLAKINDFEEWLHILFRRLVKLETEYKLLMERFVEISSTDSDTF